MKHKAFIFDIDGTLADCSQRLHFINGENKDWNGFFESMGNDKPVPSMVKILESLACDAYRTNIIFLTGRPEKYRDLTNKWLLDNIKRPVLGKMLLMRPDGDFRPDYEIKREIYRDKIKPDYNVIAVFEDRSSVVKMWRDEGVFCCQVDEGDF